jgi:hypothetical protein
VEWISIISTVIAGLGGAGGIAAAVLVFSQRRKLKAEAADVIADSAVGLLAPYREELTRLGHDLAAARAETADARHEARHARREMSRARDEAQELADTLRRWRMAILRPGVSIEELRSMVSSGESGANGGHPQLR